MKKNGGVHPLVEIVGNGVDGLRSEAGEWEEIEYFDESGGGTIVEEFGCVKAVVASVPVPRRHYTLADRQKYS